MWRTVKKTVTPLVPEPRPREAPATLSAAPAPPVPAPVKMTAARPAELTFHSFGRRERQAIVRGKREIDGRLDLHGCRQDEAHARLTGFLARGQASGWKLVLVITGKGRTASDFPALYGSERGVLRRMVPLWLSTPDLRRYVLGFEEAADSHGGGGALYVRIRRRK